jgi:hypothetical protein
MRGASGTGPDRLLARDAAVNHGLHGWNSHCVTILNDGRSVVRPASAGIHHAWGQAMKRITMLIALVLLFVANAGLAQSPRGYTEGVVANVTAVRIHDGQFDNYMAYLGKTYKPLMEAQKEAGIIVDYFVYNAMPRSPQDPNMYLVVLYPNSASLDGLMDKTEPLMQKTIGQTRAQAQKASAERASMREILGTEQIRELKLD